MERIYNFKGSKRGGRIIMLINDKWPKWNKVKLPTTYNRQGRECYLDPIRKKLIYITPEEEVRQRMISYLIKILKVPMNVIACEAHLSHYGCETKKRADILIHTYNKEDKLLYPKAVIECKSPDVSITSKEINQVIEYANYLYCDYVAIVNGIDIYCWHYNEKTDEYVSIDDFPNYKELLQGNYVELPDPGPLPPRTPYEELEDILGDYCYNGYIGENTVTEKSVPMVNLCECCLDTRHKMPAKKYKNFKLIEDYGIRRVTYSNASGGKFSSDYRSFLIEYKDSTEIISVALSTYITHAKPDILKTSVNVAIDNEKVSHHALQYVVDDNMVVGEEEYKFYHHGRIGVGHIGSGKINELREFVKSEMPELVEDNRFYLGSLPKKQLWYLDDPTVADFFANLISYSLIRDEYRLYVKNRAK